MGPAPTIAIVGRPNVGKSTLFNRLIGKKYAVVSDVAGTTRDRIFQKFDCNDVECLLVDTGGLHAGNLQEIEAHVQLQAKMAIQDANIILFMVDFLNQPTVDDFAAANLLRKSPKPVILVANKADNANHEENILNFYELGFGEPIKISSIHNLGIEELKKEITKNLKKLKYKKPRKKSEQEKMTNICILGQPNAGKSSLVNSLLGSEKIIVSQIPGTTRDTTDTEITYNEQKYNLIDTAGLRRPGKIQKGIEKYSSFRAITAIERSDIVVLLIDGIKGLGKQDTHICQHVLEQEKGLIIAINKVDLFENIQEEKDKIIYHLKRRFSFVPWAPVVFLSAKNKKNIYELLKLSDEIMKERTKRITTGEFNSFIQKITQKHLPSTAKYKRPHLFYATQADIAPPRFVFFLKDAQNLHFSYPRYLENEIRKEYGFNGTAIELKFKNRENSA